MTVLAQGAASTASVPLLSIRVSDGKRIVDPDDGTLVWALYDVSTEAKQETPVLVTSATVNLTTHRVGTATGYFAAVFTLSASEAKGEHEIRWTWEVDGVAFEWTQVFDVLARVPKGLGGGYIRPSQLRAEGLGKSEATDVRLLELIREQSDFVDMVTRRWFEPRFKTLKVDGSGSRSLAIGHPIIALETATVSETALDLTAGEGLVIYNRHIAGDLDPDDRAVPMVAFPGTGGYLEDDDDPYVSDFVVSGFPRTAQSVQLVGLFGYTDYDGSPYGRTPLGVERLVKLLVFRSLAKMACGASGFQARMQNAVTSIRTRDQSVTYADSAVKSSGVTGDREIDVLLMMFTRPLGVAVT
jgi:hypothetical protein